jgi:lipoprotein signal peptidase
MPTEQEERMYLWEHFKFNADQRIKTFNLFVIFSVFANGGAFAAFEKSYPVALKVVIGLFIFLLALVFMLIDRRSKSLTDLAVPGLKIFEAGMANNESRLFTNDAAKPATIVRYTTAFTLLFSAQMVFGIMVVGLALWLPGKV